jgi:hypothetical protein
MESGPAHSGAGGSRRGGAFAVRAAGSRGRTLKFVLAAAAGVALASGVMTGTSAAHAAVSAPAAAAVRAYPVFEPCPCINPVCRPGCSQSMDGGGPASGIHRQTHLAPAAALDAIAATAVICPPPVAPAATSSSGNPSC